MNSWPSRSATIGTNRLPATSVRESNEAPSSSTSSPTSRPPVAAATSDAAEPHPPNGTGGTAIRLGVGRRRTVPLLAVSRIHLVVLYGGQSAEHDVSCVTAAHVLAAIDPAKYRVTPIGISTDRRLVARRSRPGRPRRRSGRAPRAARHHRSVGVGDRRDRADVDRPTPTTRSPSCCRCCTARWARTAPCRGCWSWPTPPTSDPACSARRWRWTRRWPSRCSPPTASRRPASGRCATPRSLPACRRRWPPSSACRASSSRRTWARRSG